MAKQNFYLFDDLKSSSANPILAWKHRVALIMGRFPQIRPQVYLNGEMTLTHESYPGSTFNTLGVAADGVTTVMLESAGLTAAEWISLLEVSGTKYVVLVVAYAVTEWCSSHLCEPTF